MNTARPLPNHPDAPALAQARAIFALIASLITNPGAQLDALFARAEAIIARILLSMAIRDSGRSDLHVDMFDCRIVWRGCALAFQIRLKPQVQALQPLRRALLLNRIAPLARARLPRRGRGKRAIWNRLARRTARAQRRFDLAAGRRRLSLEPTPARAAIPP